MKSKAFYRYYAPALCGTLLAAGYPLWMGITVVSDMIRHGTVYAENYPKYVIPYTPISLAVIVGVALMPLILRYVRRLALLVASSVASAVFFAAELLLESLVTVTRTVTGAFSTLEGWQMYMCYVPPSLTTDRTWTEVDVLMGEYSPTFKLHFYLISLVLILALLNCFYGFGKMILTGDRRRLKPLILQSVAAAAFLGMCIWACFTAFYRTGDVKVSTLSAVLMIAFFILFGLTVGIYLISFTMGRQKLISVVLPALAASATTLIMYLAETFLLDGNLYRFGTGFFFEKTGALVLAPVDILVVLASGLLTALIARAQHKQA